MCTKTLIRCTNFNQLLMRLDALVAFTHNITSMLENNSYVRCLLINFSKAFDVVRHCIFLSKSSKLDIPPAIHNWIIAFLTGRSQLCTTSVGQVSVLFPITRSTIQGSGLSPTLWLVMVFRPSSFIRCYYYCQVR